MNKKDNQRSRLTKMLMKQAYMSLMKEKKTGRITVRDICERAEVNRSTFYLHYAEPNDLLTEIENEAIDLVKDAIIAIGAVEKPSPGVSGYLLSFFRYVRENEDLFRTLLIENSDPRFRVKLRGIVLGMAESSFHVEMSPERKQTAFLYIVSGSLDVMTDWIGDHCRLPERDVCEMLYALSEGALRSICETTA